MLWELESRVSDCAADPVAALANTDVRKSDHGKCRQPERHVDLDLHRAGLDPEHRRGAHTREHSLRRASHRSGRKSWEFEESDANAADLQTSMECEDCGNCNRALGVSLGVGPNLTRIAPKNTDEHGPGGSRS